MRGLPVAGPRGTDLDGGLDSLDIVRRGLPVEHLRSQSPSRQLKQAKRRPQKGTTVGTTANGGTLQGRGVPFHLVERKRFNRALRQAVHVQPAGPQGGVECPYDQL